MLNVLIYVISEFGVPIVVAAVLLYVLLRGEISFNYPKRSRPNSLQGKAFDGSVYTGRRGHR